VNLTVIVTNLYFVARCYVNKHLFMIGAFSISSIAEASHL